MKREQILDLASGHYEKIETFFNRPLTYKEKYEIQKSVLQVHMKYPNRFEELEYIIQRRLNEKELKNLVGNQYDEIENRLGKLLTEKQTRNILYGKDDQSLIGVEDLLRSLRKKCKDNHKRTQLIANRLIEKLDEDFNQHQKESPIEKSLRPTSRTSSYIQPKQSDTDFHQSTMNLLEQLSNDVRRHAISSQRDQSSEILDVKSISASEDKQSVLDRESITSTYSLQIEPSKAFENIPRVVEQIADKEHIEEMITVNNVIKKSIICFLLYQKIYFCSVIVEKPISNQTNTGWFSNLNKDITTTHLPAIKSMDDKLSNKKSHRTPSPTDEELYLGWTLFKGAERSDLGLKVEKPVMINVKHIAQTYVVGIPEEYADKKSKSKKMIRVLARNDGKLATFMKFSRQCFRQIFIN